MPRRTIFGRTDGDGSNLLGPWGENVTVFEGGLFAVDVEGSFEIEAVASTALTGFGGDGCVVCCGDFVGGGGGVFGGR